MKIAIVGTGRVGSTLAYCLALKQLCDHLVIAGRTGRKALGDALDLRHCLAFCARPMRIEACANSEVAGCDIIVVAASVPSDGKMTARLQLGEGNVALFRELIPMLAANNPEALLLVLSNPVDVMTYAASRLSGFPPQRVLGVGTLVDSARFRAALSQQAHIHPDDLRAYVLGEHGPHQFPVLGVAQAGGELIGDTPAHRRLFEEVVGAAFEVYQLKGYTNHAIATAAAMVIEAIVFDEHRTMPLAVRFDEWMGVEDNCFSIPVVVGRGGVVRALHPELNGQERGDLALAAAAVKEAMRSLIPDLLAAAGQRA
jgi:L-lactate dehydrogenase